MTGVEMASLYLEEAPDTAVIFMSAYSDREYLKAAIKLKAVSYIDKPAEKKELEDAIKEAADRFRTLRAAKAGAMLEEKDLRGHLALALTNSSKLEEALELAARVSPKVETDFWFTCVITSCLTPLSELPSEDLIQENQLFSSYLKKWGSCGFWCPRQTAIS